jgi:hypothetical protein
MVRVFLIAILAGLLLDADSGPPRDGKWSLRFRTTGEYEYFVKEHPETR